MNFFPQFLKVRWDLNFWDLLLCSFEKDCMSLLDDSVYSWLRDAYEIHNYHLRILMKTRLYVDLKREILSFNLFNGSKLKIIAFLLLLLS